MALPCPHRIETVHTRDPPDGEPSAKKARFTFGNPEHLRAIAWNTRLLNALNAIVDNMPFKSVIEPHMALVVRMLTSGRVSCINFSHDNTGHGKTILVRLIRVAHKVVHTRFNDMSLHDTEFLLALYRLPPLFKQQSYLVNAPVDAYASILEYLMLHITPKAKDCWSFLMAEEMIRKGASVHKSKLCTLLYNVIRTSTISACFIILLLQNGADMDHAFVHSGTLLHIIVQWAQDVNTKPAFAELLASGCLTTANFSHTDSTFKTAVQSAQFYMELFPTPHTEYVYNAMVEQAAAWHTHVKARIAAELKPCLIRDLAALVLEYIA
jgi:hypothetical protein